MPIPLEQPITCCVSIYPLVCCCQRHTMPEQMAGAQFQHTDMAGTQCRHKNGRHNQHVVPLSFMPQVSNISMPLYALLPACTEWLAENGYTLTYPRIENVGLPMYAIFFLLYMASVEFGVYWMHRGLHEVKIGYRCVNCMR